jgi:ATP-dependent Clp protease ATP-binding subunit ClpX
VLEVNITLPELRPRGGDDQKILERLNARVKPTDLLEFGLIPEFAGRLPIVTRLHDLTQEMLIRILTEPKNAIYKQFAFMLRADGVELTCTSSRPVFRQIAELAIEYKAGARSLRGIFRGNDDRCAVCVPDTPSIRKVIIRSLFEPATFVTDDCDVTPLEATTGPAVNS